MASKEAIRQLFISELKNTQEYQIVLSMKQYIIDKLLTPEIEQTIIYNFQNSLTDEQLNNVKLCMLIEFGFVSDCNNDFTIIDMIEFLEN